MFTRRALCAGGLAGASLGLFAGQVSAQGKIIRVPFELSPDLKPVVQVTLDGQGPYRFILDTGASATSIRRSLGQELGLRYKGEAMMRSVKGSERVVRHTVSQVVIGSAMKLRDWEVLSTPGLDGWNYDGLLSADLLTRLPCQLDHHAREIRYYLGAPMDLSGFAPLKSYFRTDIRGGADKVYVDIGFAGHKLSCLLDTGAATPLFIRGDYVRAQKLWDKYPVLGEGSVVGVNNKVLKTRTVEVEDIHVGGIHVPRMAVVLGDPGDAQGYGKDDPSQGLLGSPFLSGFVLAFAADRTLHVKSSRV